MGGYIGARAGSLSTTTVANVQDVTATDTTPEVTIINNTHEDTDGGREGKVIFKGQQSGGEESTLAEIQGSHDGTADDQKGDLIFKTNDGSDGASPTEAMRIDSGQNVGIGTSSPTYTLSVEKDVDTWVSRIYNTGSDANAQGLLIRTDGTAAHNTNALAVYADSGYKMVVKSSGNVGIGTSSPTGSLHISNSAPSFYMTDTTNNTEAVVSTDNAGSLILNADLNNEASSSNIRFAVDGSETMRIDSSGNLIVGETSTSAVSNGTGTYIASNGQLYASSTSSHFFNRKSTDGDIATFRKDGSTVGSIGVNSSGYPYLVNKQTGGGGVSMGTGAALIPTNNAGAFADNSKDVGASSVRFDDVYATNGTIQTSDQNEKQQIASLTDAEMTAAKAISKLFKTFKWNDSVAENGDNARTHTGVIAQQVETAMTDAGLNAGDYAFFISTTWWETQTEVSAVEADEENGIEAQEAYTRTDTYDTLEEAPEGATERNRKGIRYPELLSFVGAATEQRLTSIESRLTALEG